MYGRSNVHSDDFFVFFKYNNYSTTIIRIQSEKVRRVACVSSIRFPLVAMASFLSNLSMGASQATGEAASAVGIDLGDDSSQYQCCKLTYNQRLIGFASCFGIGLLFSLLSMFFIFYDIISFAGFYSIGNLFSIGSVFFLMGACVCAHGTHMYTWYLKAVPCSHCALM